MIKLITVILLLLCFSSLNAVDINTILEEGDKLISPPNIRGIFNLKLTSYNQDVREIEAEAYQKQVSENQENRVFIFNYPPSVKGTGLLVHSFFDDTNNRMWIYLPVIRRIKRIALETSGGGYFMGSDFTFRDLISRSSDDFDYEMIGEELLDGVPCYLIKAQGTTKAKRRNMGYLYTVNYYRKSDYLVIGIDYYSLAGELLKEYRVKRVDVLSEFLFPSKVVMSNIITGHVSQIEFTELVVEDIPDEYFTHLYLQVGKK